MIWKKNDGQLQRHRGGQQHMDDEGKVTHVITNDSVNENTATAAAL